MCLDPADSVRERPALAVDAPPSDAALRASTAVAGVGLAAKTRVKVEKSDQEKSWAREPESEPPALALR